MSESPVMLGHSFGFIQISRYSSSLFPRDFIRHCLDREARAAHLSSRKPVGGIGEFFIERHKKRRKKKRNPFNPRSLWEELEGAI
jgi:hypothetical protein